jgi:hypothetical protein
MPGLLIAKLGPYAGTFGSFLLAIKVDLGALWVVAGALAIIVAQLIAIPRRMRSFWFQEAKRREEENKVLQEQLRDKTAELTNLQAAHVEAMSSFAREQQELRHSLKNTVVGLEGQLELEKAKRDYTVVLEKVGGIQTKLESRDDVFAALAEQVANQTSVLEAIRDVVTANRVDAIAAQPV